MSEAIEDLIRRLEPLIGRQAAHAYLRDYNASRFNPTWKKLIEQEVKELAYRYDMDNQIILYPVPKREDVVGEYPLGWCYYGRYPMNAEFGLRDQDFIKHVGIFGATGAGKTNTALQLIRQLCIKGKPFLILDPKGTWQYIIRKHWANNVKLLQFGSAHAPYTFNPFTPLPGQDQDDLIASVVEAVCVSQYLGFGAKRLLQDACYAAREKGGLTLKSVYGEFRSLDRKGAKKSLWADSTERALKSATTGIMGHVLNSPDNIPFNKLMSSQVVLLLNKLRHDPDAVALVMALMLSRAYAFRELAGVKDSFENLIMLEEAHVLFNAEKAGKEKGIESLVREGREFSLGIILVEQNPGSVPSNILGNLNTIISLNLGNSEDIGRVATAMVLRTDERQYLGQLEVGQAVCRVKDRFREKVLVKVNFESMDKTPLSPEEIKSRNGDFVSPVETQGYESESEEALAGRVKLAPLDRKILRYLKINNGTNLRNLNISFGLDYGQTRRIKKRLVNLGLIDVVERVPTAAGSETRLALTKKGIDFLDSLGDARKLGGEWHRSAVERVASHYRKQGYTVLLEHRGMDAHVVELGLGIEVESMSGTKDVVRAVSNIHKALRIVSRVESVVKDNKASEKLLEALKESPLESFDAVKIRLLGEYRNRPR